MEMKANDKDSTTHAEQEIPTGPAHVASSSSTPTIVPGSIGLVSLMTPTLRRCLREWLLLSRTSTTTIPSESNVEIESTLAAPNDTTTTSDNDDDDKSERTTNVLVSQLTPSLKNIQEERPVSTTSTVDEENASATATNTISRVIVTPQHDKIRQVLLTSQPEAAPLYELANVLLDVDLTGAELVSINGIQQARQKGQLQESFLADVPDGHLLSLVFSKPTTTIVDNKEDISMNDSDGSSTHGDTTTIQTQTTTPCGEEVVAVDPWTKHVILFKAVHEHRITNDQESTSTSTSTLPVVSEANPNTESEPIAPSMDEPLTAEEFFKELNLVMCRVEPAREMDTSPSGDTKEGDDLDETLQTRNDQESTPIDTNNNNTETALDESESSTESQTSATPATVASDVTELGIGRIPRWLGKNKSRQEYRWISHSPLQEGDRILQVNGKDDICDLDPETAKTSLEAMYECTPFYLTLTARTPSSKRIQRSWQEQLRRSAVAVGGGTLLSVGSILMVTPLHPVGHAMAFGGVAVLGTEYEKPRQMAQQARTKFSNLASRFRKESSSTMEGNATTDPNTSEELVGNSATGEDPAAPPEGKGAGQGRWSNFANRFRQDPTTARVNTSSSNNNNNTTCNAIAPTESAPAATKESNTTAPSTRAAVVGRSFQNLFHRARNTVSATETPTEAGPEISV